MSLELINSYPDQLISEVWVEWSEHALNKKHDLSYTIPTGFQKIIRATSSSERTRAGELFSIGLLKGVLVNPRTGSRGVPLGWGFVQKDINVHTDIGFLSYAIGKAMAHGNEAETIKKAFSSLCAIYLLQLGVNINDRCILTSSLFQKLIGQFAPTDKKNDIKHHRYIAAGMFCTLHHELGQRLIQSFVDDTPIDSLLLIEDGDTSVLNPDDLNKAVLENRSITNISPPKASLFWIGDTNSTQPRGIYTMAAQKGIDVLKAAYEIEKHAFANNMESPFKPLIEKNTSSQISNILPFLYSIFQRHGENFNIWEALMKSLYDGVLDSLRFITEQKDSVVYNIFHPHDISEPFVYDDKLVFAVKKDQCKPKPRQEDKIYFNEKLYDIDEITEEHDCYEILVSIKT